VARYSIRQVLSFAAMYLIVSVLAVVALLVDTWPLYPRSILDWGLLLVIVLPVTVLGDWLSDRVLSSSLPFASGTRTRKAPRSWLRIGYQLALYVLFAICAVAILYWLEAPAA
jgi:hypothetical protein